MAILKDEEFRTNNDITFAHPRLEARYGNKKQTVYIYGYSEEAVEERINVAYPHTINVEFYQEYKDGIDNPKTLVDLYFHPEDLERLGVLLQYEAKKYMQLRDELVAAKVEQDINKKEVSK